MEQQLSLTSVLEDVAKLPLVRIDRNEFLTKSLNKFCTPEQLQTALTEGTLCAGIPVTILDSLANAVINAETLKVTAISTAAGIPGGIAMAATIPADLAQFYGFIIRIAQELAYIYGWDEMFGESANLDAETESQLILFIGVMSGVGAANKVVGKLFGEVAMRSVAKKVAAKALTKTWRPQFCRGARGANSATLWHYHSQDGRHPHAGVRGCVSTHCRCRNPTPTRPYPD